MTKSQLQKFFREKKAKAKPANIDWSAKRDSWIQAVEALYDTIVNDYLKPAEADVEITYSKKVVKEDYVGEYSIRELILRVGDEQVVLSPKGANVLGAKGRIDVMGDRGEAAIIWQDGDDWSIVVSRTPTMLLIPLTANSLAELLRSVMRP